MVIMIMKYFTRNLKKTIHTLEAVMLALICVISVTFLTGCSDTGNMGQTIPGNISGNDTISDNNASGVSSDISENTEISDAPANISDPEPIEFTVSGNQIRFSVFDLTDNYDADSATLIRFNEMEVTITGAGAVTEDNKIIINQPGTYLLEGSLSNGQIYVNVGSQDKVQLVLNNVDIFCNTSAPIYIENADKTVITLAEGSVNTITDSYAPLDDFANGCIYSKDDLTFNGSGTLNVTGNFNNAISCKNDLKITGGTYNITAANNGLKGNDSIAILNCTMNITSMDDGCKVSNETETDKGYLFIAGGTIEITANDDCFQSTRAVIIQGGHVLARCFGKIVNCDEGYTIGTEEYIEESR